MRIVLMGPPGAGKGTQAKKLAGSFGMMHLSSGDILRAEKASGSALGGKLAKYMDAGKLVPDEIVVDVMAKAMTAGGSSLLRRSGCEGWTGSPPRAESMGGDQVGLLLDGFPRTLPQAEALDAQLAKAGKPLDAVVVINADTQLIVKRITGRRSCPACGKVYHVAFMPPKKDNVCDKCGAALVQRDDDAELVVRQRLDAYNCQTAPVIEYYRRRSGLKMVEVDGGKDVDAVFADLARELQALVAGR